MDQEPNSFEWRTGITTYTEDQILVRGYSLTEMAGRVGFASAVYLMLKGELPTDKQGAMLDAMMVCCVDHGFAPAAAVTRIVAVSGVPMQACIAAGLLTCGDVTGGAGEQLGKVLQEAVLEINEQGATVAETAERIVTRHKPEKEILLSFAHPLHPHGDPRARRLLELADKLEVSGPHVELARVVGVALERIHGRSFPMNVDGATAAILLDIGLDWKCARALMVISRAVGVSAHAIEEIARESLWRGIPQGGVTYDGPPPRPLDLG